MTEILEFHVMFEQMVPFGDGNGRVGRLIMFKECLRHGVMPFILDDKHRNQYIKGIQEWREDRTKFMQVAFAAQERFEHQLELHKLAEYRSRAYMNQHDHDENIDDKPYVDEEDEEGHDSKRDLLLNVIGNVAMFIPSGIVLPIIYKRLDTFAKVLLAGGGISLCIEIIQLPFSVRATDIDDLILNTVGVIMGYGIHALIRCVRRTKK